jgi:puromycin-sensitive aminopeptidase
MTSKVRRLFEGFAPDHYKLTLSFDSSAMVFSGKVVISGKKKGRPSRRLTFHQKDLDITSAKALYIGKHGDEELTPIRINRQKSFDEVRLHFDHLLYPGDYQVMLEFKGRITKPMDGIYPCYSTEDGVENIILATQFESHYARQAFPCIDEPEAKATFELSLITPADASVVSNTPVAKETLLTAPAGDDPKAIAGEPHKLTTFGVTPKMSTYLLAFVCGKLKFIESHTPKGVSVRAYATPANVGHLKFALEVAVKVLSFYEDYFDIAYPLPKCDLVALPDFAAGAMENWGCITFREQALIVDPKNTSLPVKQYVALVVAHELAHQWFGNLVTMRWWTDLWLNEGFASWMEYFAVDHLYPEWQMWREFIVNEQEAALKQDALPSTHPIEVKIKHPDEIRTIFDSISYSKGSSVINMLYHYLGEEAFRDGLRHYLKAHSYGNTDTVDLWEAFQEVSSRQVKDFMHFWTSQPGFPLVTLKLGGDDKRSINITQKRFILGKHSSKQPVANEAVELWPIPLGSNVKLSSETLDKPTALFSIPKDEGTAGKPASKSLFILNSGSNGFFRTEYCDLSLQAEIKDQFISGNVEVLDRIRIMSDALETAIAGSGSATYFLNLVASNGSEESTFVWDIMVSGLGNIRSVMADENLRLSMQPFILRLVDKQLKRLGWDQKPKESHFDTLLRPTMLSLASISKDPATLSEALERFKTITNPGDADPNLRSIIYSTVAREGGDKEFKKLLDLYKVSNSSEDKVTIAAALTSFQHPSQIKKSLCQIDSPDVKLQDVSYWVAYSFANRFARDLTWDWLKSHWQWLETNLGNDLSFCRIPVYAARAYSDSSFLKEYRRFFEPRMTPGLERSYQQGCEIIRYQAEWRKRDLESIKQFFVSNKI